MLQAAEIKTPNMSGAKATVAQNDQTVQDSGGDGTIFTLSVRCDGNSQDDIRDESPRGRDFIWQFTDYGTYKPQRSEGKFCFETSLQSLKLKVYETSIIRLAVDVIVSSVKKDLTHGEGVAKVIADAAGPVLKQESKKYVGQHGNLNLSENCITSAGNLRCKHVIHALGPRWNDYSNKNDCLQALYDCICNVLETCSKKNYRIVAFPAISAGLAAVPKQLCAKVYVKAVMDMSKTKSAFPKEVHFVDVDARILQMMKDAFESFQIQDLGDSVAGRI